MNIFIALFADRKVFASLTDFGAAFQSFAAFLEKLSFEASDLASSFQAQAVVGLMDLVEGWALLLFFSSCRG